MSEFGSRRVGVSCWVGSLVSSGTLLILWSIWSVRPLDVSSAIHTCRVPSQVGYCIKPGVVEIGHVGFGKVPQGA